jgi:hypothetical protein
MHKLSIIAVLGLSLAGCAESQRTIWLPTLEERTISGEPLERARLVVPPDHRNYKLPDPKDDVVVREWQKNNFAGNVDRSATLTKPKELRQQPLPPHRPCSLGNVQGCERGR